MIRTFHPNNTKIVEEDAISLLESPLNERTIPLAPKLLELVFRTIDPEGDTLVNNTDLEVIVDGQIISSIQNSGDGTFTVPGFYSSIVSVVAEKDGYQRNDTSIRNDGFNVLHNSDQSERDIFMTIQPCDVTTLGDEPNKNYYVDEFFMGEDQGEFLFEYFTDTQPDAIKIYCGRKNKINTQSPIFSYYGATDDATYSSMVKFDCKIITVEVTGGSNWSYTVNCPD